MPPAIGVLHVVDGGAVAAIVVQGFDVGASLCFDKWYSSSSYIKYYQHYQGNLLYLLNLFYPALYNL